MIEISGDYGEGGGSIVRLAVAMSAVTKKPVRVHSIRSKRCEPGLREQHVKSIKAVAELCNATLKGAYIGSKDIEFHPREVTKKKIVINVDTSGSIGLVLQAVLLPCFFAGHDMEIEIKGGGTLGRWSPNILYTKHILLPTIKKLGFKSELDVRKYSFYPKGGGDVVAKTRHALCNSMIIGKRGNLKAIKGVSLASNSLGFKKVAERTTEAAKAIVANKYSVPVNIENLYTESLCDGSGIILWAEFEDCILGWDALGEGGKPSKDVGEDAAKGLIRQLETGATVDEYMSDQILAYMALSDKHCLIKVPELSSHAKTNMWLIEEFLGKKFNVDGNVVESK